MRFTYRSPSIALLLAAGALAAGSGCKKSSGGPGGGSWLVGDDGTMSNILPDGSFGPGYELGVDQDLLAITCRGQDTAFVVGEQGTFLRTFDGGASWDSLDLGIAATLRDVASARPSGVYVAGDGVLLSSHDDGDTFQPLPGSARSWRSIASDHSGAILLALADDGEVWRWNETDGTFTPVTTVAGAQAIAISHDGRYAAVVGEGGTLTASSDGGLGWGTIPADLDATLLAVWVTGEGDIIAVGEAGTVVRVRSGSDTTSIETSTVAAATLRAIHIDGAGIGLAAGDDGEVVQTIDGGATWAHVELPLTATIRGLDAVQGAGHY